MAETAADDRAAARGAEVVREPRGFPELGDHYASYFVGPRGFMLEVVCHRAET